MKLWRDLFQSRRTLAGWLANPATRGRLEKSSLGGCCLSEAYLMFPACLGPPPPQSSAAVENHRSL